MSEAFSYPPREHIPESQLLAEQLTNQYMLEAAYQDALHLFRADVILKFLRHNALNYETNWMVFYDDAESAGNLVCRPTVATALILAAYDNPKEGGLPIPYSRILCREQVEVDDGREFIVTDITVDHDGDAQYVIDAFPLRESVSNSTHIAPLFDVTSEGQLGTTTDITQYTAIPVIGESINGTVIKVAPFGHFEEDEDKIQALSVARQKLDQVTGLEPVFVRAA
jgi:hypothetical protein